MSSEVAKCAYLFEDPSEILGCLNLQTINQY